MMMRLICCVLILLYLPICTYAQSNSMDFARMSQATRDSTNSSNLPDTISLRYFKLSDITTLFAYKDSTLDNYFHQYDPTRRRSIDYQNLGNAGSAARNQIYKVEPHVGFVSGYDSYDIYNFKLDDFRFFENNVPHSDVFFTPVGGQQNFVIRSDFARNFDDGTSISLNYRRIRQEGFYTNQLTKTTNFGAALRYQSDNGRYTGFLSLISNINEEGQNGGVIDDRFYLGTQVGDRTNVSIFSDDAQTRYQQKQYSLINYYQLNSPETSEIQLLVRYDLQFDRRYFKFTDAGTSSPNDSLLYGALLSEGRGIRLYDKINKIKNAVYAYASDGKRLNIRVGLVYDRYDIDQQGIEDGYNNLFADFKGDIPISDILAIRSTAQLGLGDGIGDFSVRGSLNLDLGRWIDLDAGAALYRSSPSLVERQIVINGLAIPSKPLTKPVGTEIFGSFEIPKVKIKGQLSQSLVTNAIYWDEDAMLQQSDDIFSSTNLTLANEIQVGKLALENYAMFQVFSDNIYNLPTIFSKHNLYLTGYLFDRALLGRVGAEVRLAPSHTGASYNPVFGKFIQSSEEVPFYPATDMYLTGKIQKARLFLRFENINNLFQEQIYYQIVGYPQFDFKIRFGVSWLFLN